MYNKLNFLSLLSLAILVAPVFSRAQGPLTPPGAPAPSMKTLEQIEARTPISSIPITISTPGSYYLTANLTGASNSAGITISASDVTLDLNGFALTGVPGSLEGINVPAAQNNIAIRNGTIRDWGLFGVDANKAENSIFEGLRLFTNGWDATSYGLRVGPGSVVKICVAEANRGGGIWAITGCMVNECIARFNNGVGIYAAVGSTVSKCTSLDNSGGGISVTFGGTVSHCASRNNGDYGISANSGGTVTECSAFLNAGDGINVQFGGTVSKCSTYANGVNGITASYRSTVSECTTAANTEHGIEVWDDCRVLNNICGNNGNGGDGAGIYVSGQRNRIDGNTVSGNDRGLDIDAADNTVIGNTVLNNTDNYDIAAGNQLNLLLGELPESIDWPASVKLAGTLTGTSGTNGIIINADNVTIDLDGHALVGVPGSLEGIIVPSSQKNITIRNGTVRDWGLHGVDAWNAENSILEGLRAYTNGWDSTVQDGLRVGDNSVVTKCVASGNKTAGIRTQNGCILNQCISNDNGMGIQTQDDCTLNQCIARNNTTLGIWPQLGCIVSDCTASDNGSDGFYSGDSFTLIKCVAYRNGDDGIEATGASQVSQVIDCTVKWNSGDGIIIQSGLVRGCSVALNIGDGIKANTDCRIANNHCDSNGYASGDGAGIHVTGRGCQIENNVVTDNDRGIDVDDSGNLIIRNSAQFNSFNYTIVANNKVGPIVSAPNSTSISGSTGGAGVGSTNPWANFSF